MSNDNVTKLDRNELGPASAALSPQHFNFAVALFTVPPGVGAAEAAAVLAGYTFETKKELTRATNRLACDPRIIAAVEEMARQRLTLDVPQALETLRQAMSDKFSKDQVKSAEAILRRVIPERQEIKVSVEQKDQLQITLDLLAHMLAIGTSPEVLAREFGAGGLVTYTRMLESRNASKPQVVDAEYTVIEEDDLGGLL
jgi:hypothetical protein